MVRTRFAPSPTGFVHIGSLRTALFAFLFARHNQGVNILRVEDTDQNRKVEGAVENLLRVMKEVGVEFDEGFILDEQGAVIEKGEKGPYLQSQRLPLYHKYVDQLLAEKKAYYCFCSEERLDEVRKEQMALKKPPMYDRLCRNLSDSEVKTKLAEFAAAGKNPVVRFAMPLEGETIIHDLIYGDIRYEHKILDDQVILKSDKFPTYHLAVVVDDHLMEVTHVIRGEEWIPSTPKHLLIYQALGWQPTQFAHLPLIVNPDKTKLAKRQGDVSVEGYLQKGYLKEALVNFVAFLGWNPKTDQEIFSLQELIEQFDLSKVNKSAAVFDIAKLDWINSQYIRKLDSRDLKEKLLPFWQAFGVDTHKFEDQYLISIAALEQERLKKLSEIGERTSYFFSQPQYEPELLVWKKSDKQDAKQKLAEVCVLLSKMSVSEFKKVTLESNLKEFIQSKSYDTGAVLWPLRVAMTGLKASPGPFEVLETLILGLGKEAVLERLKVAEGKL